MVTGNAGLSILPMLRKIPTWSVSAFGWIFERNELLIYEQPGREALCRDYHADNMAGEDSRVHQNSAEGGYTGGQLSIPYTGSRFGPTITEMQMPGRTCTHFNAAGRKAFLQACRRHQRLCLGDSTGISSVLIPARSEAFPFWLLPHTPARWLVCTPFCCICRHVRNGSSQACKPTVFCYSENI